MAEPSPPPNPQGLPPVVPPSGRMIAQLFVVPGLIVAGAVAILLGFSWLAGGARTPEGFLDGLRSANPEVRWRAASDLAQVLVRDDSLAGDPKFAVEIVTLLNDARADLRTRAAVKPATVNDEDRRAAAAAWKEFLARRSEVQYLTACAGNLIVPAAAPVLADMATSPVSRDEKSDALLRRQAAWALGTLGHSRQRYDRLATPRKEEILIGLDRLAARAGEPATWAKSAADILRGQGAPAVFAALAKIAESDDPFLRKQAALALSFWPGSEADARRAEDVLMRLTRDDGRGQSVEITDVD